MSYKTDNRFTTLGSAFPEYKKIIKKTPNQSNEKYQGI